MLMTDNRIELEEPTVRRAQQNEIRNTKGLLHRTNKTSTITNEPMNKANSRKTSELLHRRDAPLETRTDLTASATKDITGAMNAILADVFALYVKTKNFHWHMVDKPTSTSTLPVNQGLQRGHELIIRIHERIDISLSVPCFPPKTRGTQIHS